MLKTIIALCLLVSSSVFACDSIGCLFEQQVGRNHATVTLNSGNAYYNDADMDTQSQTVTVRLSCPASDFGRAVSNNVNCKVLEVVDEE